MGFRLYMQLAAGDGAQGTGLKRRAVQQPGVRGVCSQAHTLGGARARPGGRSHSLPSTPI